MAHLKPAEWRRIAAKHLTNFSKLIEELAVDHRDLKRGNSPSAYIFGTAKPEHAIDVPSSMISALVRVHRCSAC